MSRIAILFPFIIYKTGFCWHSHTGIGGMSTKLSNKFIAKKRNSYIGAQYKGEVS